MVKISRFDLNIGLKIVHLSDLHSRKYPGLIEMIANESPDLIFVTGDTFEFRDEKIGKDPEDKSRFHRIVKKITYGIIGSVERPNIENSYSFLRDISNIAPTYISMGNHEWYFQKKDCDFLSENGITLLDNCDVSFNGYLIGGLSTKVDADWLENFKEKKSENKKLLLCHHPEYYKKYDLSDIDCVFSGHAHGGQIRFFNIAAYGPGQGLFPKIYDGLYFGNLVVSPGLSNTLIIPRINNPKGINVVY